MIRVSEINIYPIKGLHRISVHEASVERRGLRFDRRWMVVDPQGLFMSQRSISRMATIRTEISEGHLTLTNSHSSISIPIEDGGPEVRVRVWRDEVEAVEVACAGGWLTEALGVDCRLVRVGERFARPTNPQYSLPGDEVGLADGYPFLLANESSLTELNSRLREPAPMSRFRPNIVLSGAEPWGEDDWRTLKIGEVQFRNVKPCGRCIVTTTDQETGVVTGDEPLRTLATFRLVGNTANFGVNLIPDSIGRIRVGDSVLAA